MLVRLYFQVPETSTTSPTSMCQTPYQQSEFAAGGEYASDEICGVTPIPPGRWDGLSRPRSTLANSRKRVAESDWIRVGSRTHGSER